MEKILLLLMGLVCVALSILFLRKEKSLYANSTRTTATLYGYDEARGLHYTTMYTMKVEYTLEDGTVMRTQGLSSSSRIKYPVGTALEIVYSAQKPERFEIVGDHSRTVMLYGMLVMGIALAGIAAYMYVTVL